MSESLASSSPGSFEAAPPSPVALLFLRGRDADGRIAALVAERRGVRPLLGVLSLPLVKRRRYEALGFRSLGDYARERLGVSAQVVRDWARVTEALASLPAMRAAVLSGEVSWSVAQRAVPHATPETDAAFVETLRGRTVRAAEVLLGAVFGSEMENPEAEDPADRVQVSVPLPAAHHGRWQAALELARRMAGESLPVWECAEAIAAEALGAIPRACVAAAAAASGDESSVGQAVRRAGVPDPPSREHGLRHEAFRLLRWRHGAAASDAELSRVSAWAGTASPHALDAALGRALKSLQRIDHDLGHLLRQVVDRKLYRELGFPSFARYVEERVEVSSRTARRWVRMARLGPVGSVVAHALRAGSITPKQADIVWSAVPPSHQAEAVAFARAVTLRRLEDEHGGAVHGATVRFTAPPEAANVFALALSAARLHLRAGPAEALLWMLDHAIKAWAQQGAKFRDTADFVRDGFRCTAPGCTARRNLQSHHIVFRSHGGPDEAWNRTTLCAFHHLRGIHARTISCHGRAPDGLVFALGLRAEGPPLLRVGAGDVLFPQPLLRCRHEPYRH